MTAQDLARIHAACFPERPWSGEELAALVDKATVHLLTSPCGQGFLLAQSVADEAELLTIAVAPEAQRGGIAKQLLRLLLDDLRAKDAQCLFLEVASDNAAARALYQHFGFEQVGLRKGYYAREGAPPADGLVLRLQTQP